MFGIPNWAPPEWENETLELAALSSDHHAATKFITDDDAPFLFFSYPKILEGFFSSFFLSYLLNFSQSLLLQSSSDVFFNLDRPRGSEGFIMRH